MPETTAGELRERVESARWYHTLELAPGLVTPGWFDLRSVAARLPIPASLTGKRCLDVGTFDGFWAFEMERRGASEVVAIDLPDPAQWDWPALSSADVAETFATRTRQGAGFELAHQALASNVERLTRSVYELDPADTGRFDFIYLGSLLLHLRDPVRALERVRDVCQGELLVVDVYDPLLSRFFPRLPIARLDGRGRPWWWQSNIACLVRMIEAAGFELVARPRRILLPPGSDQPSPPLRLRTLLDREQRQRLRNARLGDPHVALLARPRQRNDGWRDRN